MTLAFVLELHWAETALLASGLGFVSFVVWRLFPGPITTPEAKLGIVSLEFGFTPGRVKEIIDSWRAARMLARVRRHVLWDFAWIPTYAAFIAVVGAIAARVAHWGGFVGEGTAEGFALALASAAGLAGVLDVGENVAQLRLLRTERSTEPPRWLVLAGAAPALLKWALLLAVAVTATVLFVGAAF